MKQQRYLDKDGKRDWIDKCADEMTINDFNAAMLFTIGKYYQRLGKKDQEQQEMAKIWDYMKRWSDVLQGVYVIDGHEAMRRVVRDVKKAKALANNEE